MLSFAHSMKPYQPVSSSPSDDLIASKNRFLIVVVVVFDLSWSQTSRMSLIYKNDKYWILNMLNSDYKIAFVS